MIGQAIFYAATFALQISFNTATRVIQKQTGQTYLAFFAPLNGFWHGLIYLRPRFLSLKEKHPSWRKRHVIRSVLSRVTRGRNEDGDNDHELGVLSNPGDGPVSSENSESLEDSFSVDVDLNTVSGC